MGHLETSSSEAALDVEALVGLTAVEDALITTDLLGDVVEGLDDSETQLLALLVLCDGDILDMADGAKVVDAARRVGQPPMPAWDGVRLAYNFRSTMRAPVPTTGRSARVVSSMMMM